MDVAEGDDGGTGETLIPQSIVIKVFMTTFFSAWFQEQIATARSSNSRKYTITAFMLMPIANGTKIWLSPQRKVLTEDGLKWVRRAALTNSKLVDLSSLRL